MTDKRIRIILDSKGAQRSAKELDNDVREIGKSAETTQFAINRLAAAIASAFAVDRIARYADAWTQVENQIRRTVETEEDLVRTTAELLDVSNQTRSSIEATTALYTSLSISTERLGTTQEEVIDVTKTINNLFLEAGKSAEETAGAIRQLGQALESGALRGDEFNSVAEGAPGILRAIEKQTGRTRAELRELAADGQITAELIVDSLQNYSEEAQRAADITERTLAQSFQVAENNAIAYVGASRLVGEVTEVTGEAIVALSNNIDVLIGVAGAAAALYVARLIPSITASTAGFISQAAAALKATQTVNAMGVVVSSTTVRMNALTLATRGATAALSFLGGPAGVLFLAVAALGAYSLSTSEASEETEDLSTKTDVLTQSYKDLTSAQASAQRIDVVNEIKQQEAAIDDLQAKIDRFRVTTEEGFILTLDGFDEEVFTRSEAAIDSAQQKLELLRQRLGQLDSVIAGEDPADSGQAPSATPSGDGDATARFQAQLESQTNALRRELDNRRQISAIYRQGELDAQASQFEQERAAQQVEEQTRLAEAQAKAEEDSARRQEQFLAGLERLTLENEERVALQEEFDLAEITAQEILQEQLTAIEEQGAKDRDAIARAEAAARIDTWSNLATSGLKILQSFGSQSFQSQKNFAIAEGIVNIAGGVAKALNNPYPANLAFAAQVGLQGAALINTIRSTKPKSGGSAPSISGSAATPASSGQTASNVQPEERAPTTITIVGLNPDDLITGRQLAQTLEEFSSEGGVIRANFENEGQ